MNKLESPKPDQTSIASHSGAWYRAIWRWHFYAGLLVLPFMVLLAVTGGIYLFHDEFDAVYYHDWNLIEARQTPMLPASVLVEKAAAEMPGDVTRITLPVSPGSAAKLFSTTVPGAQFTGYTGYVDPYTGEVLGVTDLGGIMGVVSNLHSLEYFGFLANCLIEIVAGWALILVATGVFLWWPRGRNCSVLKVRGSPGKRVFWRDLHAVTGIFAGLVIAFLAITGMPWSAVWGQGLHALVADAGLGSPPVPESTVSTVTHAEHLGATSWTLDSMPVPRSQLGAADSIGLDQAIARFKQLGFAGGYEVALPGGPTGVYSASVNTNFGDRENIHVVHLDQYTGKVLSDMRFDDFGLGSQAIGWGIAVHQGDKYGLLNQLIMLAGCIAIVVLAVSASVMWWKRRPQGALGVPPAPQDKRTARTVFAIIAIGGVVFPLVGLSILVAIGLDWSVSRGLRGLRDLRGRREATA